MLQIDCEVTEPLVSTENGLCFFYVVLQCLENLWLSSNVTVNENLKKMVSFSFSSSDCRPTVESRYLSF